mmetsp:Transcript_5706/g.9056  ORF Transcript_5706/g.9056 Transcript_5706/m.9056 type:complete len:225 (-) Transcript_5706:3-677(-)
MIQFTFALLIFMSITVGLFMTLTLVLFASSLTVIKIAILATVSLLCGLGGAYYLTKFSTKYGIAILAGFGMMSLALITVPLLGINGVEHSNQIKLGIYIVAAVAGFLVAAKFSDGIQVFVTAFIGSYFFVRGISMFAGGFINEFDLAKVEGGETDIKIEPIFYGYLAAIFILFIVGVLVQRKLIKNSEDKFKQDEDNQSTQVVDEEEETGPHPLDSMNRLNSMK